MENTPESSGSSSERSSMASIEDERKVSVREATQKFNRLASESQVSLGRSSGKSNRNSRYDRVGLYLFIYLILISCFFIFNFFIFNFIFLYLILIDLFVTLSSAIIFGS